MAQAATLREEAPYTVIDARTQKLASVSLAVDALFVVVLIVLSYVARRDGLPHNGLWHDDAWPATGALRASLSQLLIAGSGHPGFTGLLMVWDRVSGGGSTALAYPALVAGTVGPAALYLLLRSLGYATSISALIAAALVVADIPVLYSTRVKTYVLDVLIVIALAALVSRLADRRWRPRIALTWVVIAVALGFFSGFGLLATAVAGVVIVLHPVGDRLVRVTAVGTQAVIQVLLLRQIQATSDLRTIEEHQETLFDGHVDFDANPLRFGEEVLKHVRRIGTVFPGGPEWWLAPIVIVAVAGLVIAATSRTPASRAAQFLGLAFLAAFAGGILDQFPFGPGGGWALSRGERSSIWLVPVVAVGLAATLHFVRSHAERKRPLRIGFDIAVLASAVLILVGAFDHAPSYPFPGSRSSTRFIESSMGRGDVALITQTSIYPHGVESRFKVTLVAQPQRIVGFRPNWPDRPVYPLGSLGELRGTPEEVRRIVEGKDRVFVSAAIPILGARQIESLEHTLRATGFEEERTLQFDAAQVKIWRASGSSS